MVSSTPLVAYLHTAMSAAGNSERKQQQNKMRAKTRTSSEDKNGAGKKGAVASLSDAGHGDPTLRVLPQLKILA